jgi:hypothetical protein
VAVIWVAGKAYRRVDYASEADLESAIIVVLRDKVNLADDNRGITRHRRPLIVVLFAAHRSTLGTVASFSPIHEFSQEIIDHAYWITDTQARAYGRA